MIDVFTSNREDEIKHWCQRMFGDESSPMHGWAGAWRRANVTMHGWTWYGFKSKELMERFQAKFPSPDKGCPETGAESGPDV
jgi:hypothetical protein